MNDTAVLRRLGTGGGPVDPAGFSSTGVDSVESLNEALTSVSESELTRGGVVASVSSLASLDGLCGLRGGEGRTEELRESLASFFSGGVVLSLLTASIGGGRLAPLERAEEDVVRGRGGFFVIEGGGVGSGNCRRLAAGGAPGLLAGAVGGAPVCIFHTLTTRNGG